MKKITILLSLFLLLTGCGIQQTRDLLTTGNYDPAIANALAGLRGNKNAKGKQEYVYMLEEAFAKAKERDLRNINIWFKEGNPQNSEKIYSTYVQLNNRQEQIRPLLPLKLLKEGRDALFPFDDYSEQMISSKNALSKFLYDNAKGLMANKDKVMIRRAYSDLAHLESINPGYKKDVSQLMSEAKSKGTDYVNVYTKNETNMIIPTDLQNDLLDFSTCNLDDNWTVYHSTRQKGINYDYGLLVNFRQINISPEQVKEKQFDKEKQIKDGVTNVLDSRGNVVKDSHGKPVTVDKMKTVRVSIYEFAQVKACQVTAKVDYIDYKTNQLLQTFPLSSEFIFSNTYANYKGDKSACEENYYPNFDRRPLPFPTNEQMVYDTGEDLKLKLKDILVRNKFR